MLNMEKIGQKIAELRKSQNMTQLELADKMGISFQAISNWERGNSMPDISKLPELAALFHVTVDELLGEKSKLVESAVNGDLKEYVENNDVSSEEIRNVAPMLKPNQVDEIFESKKISKLSDLEDVLPFLNRDTVDKLMIKAVEEGNYHDLDSVAPFASKKAIKDVTQILVKGGREYLDGIAPFISKEDIGEIADNLYQTAGLKALEDIAPFIPKRQLEQIAQQEYANRGLRHFESIAPFLNRDYLNTLARKAVQKDGIKAISSIACFIDKNVLLEFVKEEYL